MKTRFILIVATFVILLWVPNKVFSRENNRFGVHILDPGELEKAAQLVNSNGGDWGYITIPIRANDKDLKKWQSFMDDARRYHLIPIVRIASTPLGDIWQKPVPDDIIDFSNFLNDLSWPTKARYVAVFNEPNRHNEWGGKVNPEEYGYLLEFAIDRFKSLNSDFVILPGALDASVPDSKTSMSEYRFLSRLFAKNPTLASKITAINSHSYPNPAYSGSPSETHAKSIRSFVHEANFFRRYIARRLEIFITETGWQDQSIPQNTIGNFYKDAFTKAWSDDRIQAVTPFLLHAASGDFKQFSLTYPDGNFTASAKAIMGLNKAKGDPELASIPSATPSPEAKPDLTPVQVATISTNTSDLWKNIESAFFKIKLFFVRLSGKQLFRINETYLTVEVADTDGKRIQGLSGRKVLPANEGMIFIFPREVLTPFWMKDMNFSLDFIWIKNGKVIRVDTNIPSPEKNEPPIIIHPTDPYDSVIETNAGFVRKHNLEIGDIVGKE